MKLQVLLGSVYVLCLLADAQECITKEESSIDGELIKYECSNLQPTDCCARCETQPACQASDLFAGCCSYYSSIRTTIANSTAVTVSPTPIPTPEPTPTPTPVPTPAPPPFGPKPPCGSFDKSQGHWTLTQSCTLDCTDGCNFFFDVVRIKANAVLNIAEGTEPVQISARIFIVNGKLTAGTLATPLQRNFTIVLTGTNEDQENPNVYKFNSTSHGFHVVPYSKVLVATQGSTVSLHGMNKASWIKLAQTATAGSKTLLLREEPIGWGHGDRLVVPTTEMVPANDTDHTNDEVTLDCSGASGKCAQPIGSFWKITTMEPLKYNHYGDAEDHRLNGEVAVLSHNIKILGDNEDEEHQRCIEALQKHKPFSSKDRVAAVRDACYGGNTLSIIGSSMQISNVEFVRMGQATRIARYPIHFHLAANQSQHGSYVLNNSVRDSYQRCVTVHGTWGVKVRHNVCYHTHGHAYYLEDGIEFENEFHRNLAVRVRPGPMVCTDSQVGPSAFWITNPNNTFTDNLAVDIGNNQSGIGYWFISGGSVTKETGPSYLSTNYWDTSPGGYADQMGGHISNPSMQVFGPDPSIPSWVTKQQQARTPFRSFAGNGARSSFRGVHIDGFITASIPGEIPSWRHHHSEDIFVFNGTDYGGPADGTCTYFPAGDYALPSAEGAHVYAPVNFVYNKTGDAVNFTPAYSIMDGLHVSRCYNSWWSRAARINITNSLFAWNWMGMTNHIPGDQFCEGDVLFNGNNVSNPGLAHHIKKTLFIGHGDDSMNEILCKFGIYAKDKNMDEPPAAIRQYDGAFYLHDSRWTNFTTMNCKCHNIPGFPDCLIKSLPYSLLAGRQRDCNGKFPVQLWNSWPLGASKQDKSSAWYQKENITPAWTWAFGPSQATPPPQNVVSLTGITACSYKNGQGNNGVTGGVVDMTGTLGGLEHQSSPKDGHWGYYAVVDNDVSHTNPGELAEARPTQLKSSAYPYRYSVAPTTVNSLVPSYGWSMKVQKDHNTCSYCFYDHPITCPKTPQELTNVTFV